jgi:hypothetical protein
VARRIAQRVGWAGQGRAPGSAARENDKENDVKPHRMLGMLVAGALVGSAVLAGPASAKKPDPVNTAVKTCLQHGGTLDPQPQFVFSCLDYGPGGVGVASATGQLARGGGVTRKMISACTNAGGIAYVFNTNPDGTGDFDCIAEAEFPT